MSCLQHPPCDPKWPVSQNFGENPDDYARWGLWGHDGVDFALPVNEPVYAASFGSIASVGDDPPGYGLYVKADTDFGDWLVAHLSKTMVRVGDHVTPGQVIGLSGNSGNSTGPHLHFSMRVRPYARKDGWSGRTNPAGHLDDIVQDAPAFPETLRDLGDAAQVLQFNPNASLQRRIFADGFVPNSGEFDFAFGDREFRAQRAERLDEPVVVRYYYCQIPIWNVVYYVEIPPT